METDQWLPGAEGAERHGQGLLEDAGLLAGEMRTFQHGLWFHGSGNMPRAIRLCTFHR